MFMNIAPFLNSIVSFVKTIDRRNYDRPVG